MFPFPQMQQYQMATSASFGGSDEGLLWVTEHLFPHPGLSLHSTKVSTQTYISEIAGEGPHGLGLRDQVKMETRRERGLDSATGKASKFLPRVNLPSHNPIASLHDHTRSHLFSHNSRGQHPGEPERKGHAVSVQVCYGALGHCGTHSLGTTGV